MPSDVWKLTGFPKHLSAGGLAGHLGSITEMDTSERLLSWTLLKSLSVFEINFYSFTREFLFTQKSPGRKMTRLVRSVRLGLNCEIIYFLP